MHEQIAVRNRVVRVEYLRAVSMEPPDEVGPQDTTPEGTDDTETSRRQATGTSDSTGDASRVAGHSTVSRIDPDDGLTADQHDAPTMSPGGGR
jgi:hypothetical protein